ncbi:MAG: AAA family ATPase [Propionibacteriaceae bacterium]|nr:AAA family ATPase [Propionibacteriaceae bacterium]
MELVERHLLGVGREYLGTFPVVVIEGARQVGKSTLAQQLLQGRSGTQVTLDVPAQLDAALEDPEAFLRQGGEGTLVIDCSHWPWIATDGRASSS